MISPLLTDLYQLTMAYGYWKLGLAEREAVFHLIFRRSPFKSNFALACGLATVIEFLNNWRFSAADLDYLRSLRTANQEPLFSEEFVLYLQDLRFSCDLDAIPEGTVVFPQEPLLRIKGPLLQGQLLESTLLNIVNFQTLIATKAARVCLAAEDDSVLEFGLRRAQGPDGALAASRAAYVGGCEATSNVLAGKLYDIPVRGTHAHSWVTVFPNELQAFEAFAEVMPHNCVLLVDTYETIRGVKHAITIAKQLRAKGIELFGIRLDSGDMAALSIKARHLLDEAGFPNVKIVASNSLDEYQIASLKAQGAKISVWGVGTNLVTAYDQPALDGVYKLSALQNAQGEWEYKLKLSEQSVKVSNPGIYQVRRLTLENKNILDVMFDVNLGIPATPVCFALDEPQQAIKFNQHDAFSDLLVPIFARGKLVYDEPSIHVIRNNAKQAVKQFVAAYPSNAYPVGLEAELNQVKQKLIIEVSSNLP